MSSERANDRDRPDRASPFTPGALSDPQHHLPADRALAGIAEAANPER